LIKNLRELKQRRRIKNLTSQFFVLFESDEEFARAFTAYNRAIRTDDWRFFVNVIRTVQGSMLEDMLSAKFTNLDETEKDVTQRAYYMTHQILTMFLDPAKWVGAKQSRWQQPKPPTTG